MVFLLVGKQAIVQIVELHQPVQAQAQGEAAVAAAVKRADEEIAELTRKAEEKAKKEAIKAQKAEAKQAAKEAKEALKAEKQAWKNLAK